MCLILILTCCLFSFVFVSFSTKTFTFRIFIHGCLFGGRLGFSPRWGPLSLSPSQFVQLCWATLFSSDHEASRNLFSGPFRIPAKTFSFFSPHYISLCLRNQASKNVKCHRTVDCRDQTVTERPVRPRVSAPVFVEILAYVFMCHTPVTLIKSTYYYYIGGRAKRLQNYMGG